MSLQIIGLGMHEYFIRRCEHRERGDTFHVHMKPKQLYEKNIESFDCIPPFTF